MTFHQELITKIKNRTLTEKQLAKLKRDLALKYHLKSIPTNIEILLQAEEQDVPELKKKLMTKPTRTISGVAPVAIMTKPFPCPHGKCIYCPGGPHSEFGDVPQSYTGKEPATMRGIRNNYDPYLQVFNRLEQYIILGHNCEKVELIIMGGTFPSFPVEYQEEFVKYAFKALNDFSKQFYDKGREFNYLKFKKFFELPATDLGDKKRIEIIQQKSLQLKNKTSLKQEQERNETAKIRCVALCIETRPDYGMLEHGKQMLKLGCTRIELGVQSVDNNVLNRIMRGHTSAETKLSIQVLKNLGFKVSAHYMPGLPGVKDDLKDMKQLFTNPDYRPDMLKIYPCMVIKGTELYELWKQGKFKPLTAEKAAKLIADFKPFIPEYCRVQRVQRDIPTYQIAAGVEMTNLRQYLKERYAPKCRCIRCREPQGKAVNWNKVKVKVTEYEASGGKEFFISAEDTEHDLLIGFCRLRFPTLKEGSALIRELHVYGTATAIGEQGSVQHKGWGKKLMQTAEEIASAHSKNKLVVISGIGAKEYYKKIGYHKERVYMYKDL